MMPQPQNVGIMAMEVHISPYRISQKQLEERDGVDGKYTKGLAQEYLSYCEDREDAISMALTAVANLLRKWDVDARQIGRIDVGSESNPDRSKSIKTHIMGLCSKGEWFSVEGADNVNGCYGATAALFNAVNWVESGSWDGRLALVVASDIAVYPAGSSAMATGGCGAVAMLVGPDACLVLDAVWRASHCEHAYDFWKPCGVSVYPELEGAATVHWYLKGLDSCYVNLVKKLCKSRGVMGDVDFFVAHAPYNKIVQKAFARLNFQDMLRRQDHLVDSLAKYAQSDPDNLPFTFYSDKALDASLLSVHRFTYECKVSAGAWLQQQVGNMYTASLYGGLAALIERVGNSLEGKRILLFSYGSGIMCSLFSILPRQTQGRFTLDALASKLDLSERLDTRIETDVVHFDAAQQQVEACFCTPAYSPRGALKYLRSGTFFLDYVDNHYRRRYGSISPPQ